MKYLKKYNHFLLEAVLNFDDSLIDKLKSYSVRGDVPDVWKKIANFILEFIGKDSFKNRFDMVSTNQQNNKHFLIQAGKQKNSQSVAKVIRTILVSYRVDLKAEEIKDDAIQKFSDDLIGAIKFETVPTGEIKIVQGDDIKYWYNGANSDKKEGSELYNSCMKGKMDKLDIYSKNDNVKLVIKLNSEGKLVARALLWKLDYSEQGYDWFLDRVYFNDIMDKSILFNWVKSQSGYEKTNRKVENFEIVKDVMIVKLENVLFNSYPYIDTFNLYIDKQGNKFINEGFLSNETKTQLQQEFTGKIYSELVKRINNYVEFICKRTDGKIKSTHGELLGEIEGKLIKGFSDKIKKELLPIDVPLNELKNRINLINTFNDTGDINYIFKMVDIKPGDELNGLIKLNVDNDIYANEDFRLERVLNGDYSDSQFEGIRVIVYDITDLLSDRYIDDISEKITPDSFRVNGRTYMTELDCMIIGIYDRVKDSKKYFADDNQVKQRVNGLYYNDVTQILKKEMNLTDDDELIQLRKMFSLT